MTADLYDTDFITWSERQAYAIRKAAAERVNVSEPIDWANVAEEIESLGKEQLFRLDSAYAVLVQHLLKWSHQPKRRSRSWQLTIAEQRRRISKILDANLALASRRAPIFQSAYLDARKLAAAETGIDLAVFPETPSFDVVQAEDDTFLPA